jgi:hypothetical protein
VFEEVQQVFNNVNEVVDPADICPEIPAFVDSR